MFVWKKEPWETLVDAVAGCFDFCTVVVEEEAMDFEADDFWVVSNCCCGVGCWTAAAAAEAEERLVWSITSYPGNC